MPTSPSIDWSASAAWIALVISIITPSISLLLNNIHQRKLKKLELLHLKEIEYYHQCKEAYENFIHQSASQLYSIGGNRIDYERAYQKLFLYIPSTYWDKLKDLNKAIISKSDSTISYNEFTEILATLLQTQQKRIPI